MVQIMPYVYEKHPGGIEKAYDLPSRLLKDRIMILNGEFNDAMAHSIISQLLYLDSEDSSKPIQMYIQSPGGSVTSGMAILDTMKVIKAPVHTIVVGLAASMGAFIAAMGDHRSALPSAEIMIHQPLGGAQGQASDILISANRIVKMREILAEKMAGKCGKTTETLLKDMDRDKWFFAEEAKEYGLIDEVIPYTKKDLNL